MFTDQKIIPISKAASVLGCSEERVHELADQSFIRRQHEGDQCFVYTEDIAELKRLDIIGEMRPGEMVRRMLMLETRVEHLQHALDILYEVTVSLPVVSSEWRT